MSARNVDLRGGGTLLAAPSKAALATAAAEMGFFVGPLPIEPSGAKLSLGFLLRCAWLSERRLFHVDELLVPAAVVDDDVDEEEEENGGLGGCICLLP